MAFDPLIHHRRSIRLAGFDYGSARTYFVTLCTAERQCCLGSVHEERVGLTEVGQVVEHCLADLPRHRARVAIDSHVVMPNHVHALIRLMERESEERVNLSEVVRGFKTFSARQVNERLGVTGQAFWQRGYYEHTVRDDDELWRIRAYIAENPAKWARDRNNPNHP